MLLPTIIDTETLQTNWIFGVVNSDLPRTHRTPLVLGVAAPAHVRIAERLLQEQIEHESHKRAPKKNHKPEHGADCEMYVGIIDR